MQLPLAPTTPDKGASRHLAVRSDSDKYFRPLKLSFRPGLQAFASWRVRWRRVPNLGLSPMLQRLSSMWRGSAMKQLMPFVVALLSLTGAALRAQNISASTQLKLHAGRRVLVLAGREMSGEQLEQMIAGSHREPDVKVAKRLSELELTERLSAARLARCEANLRGPDARRALRALADRSSFLDLQHPKFLPSQSQIRRPSGG